MMEVQTGTKAATRQSWGRDSIRQYFRDVQRDNPKAEHRDLVRLMCDQASEDRNCLVAAMDYIVTNFTNTQEAYGRRAPPSPEKLAAWRQSDAAQRASIKQQIMLLNLPMANGKLARNCTGAELMAMGGQWTAVGKKVGRTRLLGQVMDEEHLQSFFRGV